MCGIAGLMTRSGQPPDTGVLDRLQAAIAHRGPDSAGRAIRGGTGLVSTRLAIIDVEHGQQPFEGPRGTVLVANGEIYNAPELRESLPGAQFRTLSDCEPAVHLYAAGGIDYAHALRGMYGIAIADDRGGRLVLSRDPFGIKPLYYAETETCFAFASEPQALIKAGLVRAGVSRQRCAELLQVKFTTGAETIFPGIMRVLPGETLVIENGRIAARHRENALPAPAQTSAAETALATLDAILTESVAIHLRSDVPYGLFLSGGIDSSTVLTLMRRITHQKVLALTIGYSGHEAVDESGEALRIAKLLGADCQRIEMSSNDFWQLAPRIAAAIDDPTTDAAVLPTYMLGRAAAQAGLKVTLCGEGADELFGGYGRYRRAQAPRRWIARKPRTRGVLDAAGIDGPFAGWRDGIAAAEAREATPGRSRLQVLQAIDCAEWLPNDLLTKLDRCLMAHGVEGRTPFLDPVVANFAFNLPDRQKVGLRLGKLLLREWLATACPGTRTFARKKGFETPVGQWMQARHEQIAPLVARQPGVAAMLGKEAITQLFRNAAKRSQAAWSVLFYALWHSHHILGLGCEGDIADVLGEAAR